MTNSICWICGNDATTREHSQKKTDIQAAFGKGSYKGKGVFKLDFDKRKKYFIQGPDSKALKYDSNLCEKCNSNTTKLHDLAYQEFSLYIRENIVNLNRCNEIDTNIVFGKENARRQRQNLFRYFMKAFGCQLVDKALEVPKSLSDVILGSNWGNDFRVSVCINDVYEGYVQNFPLKGDKDQYGKSIDYYWAQHTGWYTIIYAYNRNISSEFGAEWFGKARKFRTGKL